MIERPFILGAIASWLLLTVFACSKQPEKAPQTTTITQTSQPAVTQLEPPQAIASTQLEVQQPLQTTTTSVQVEKTLSELQAEKTSSGIRINLPENILFDFDKSELRPTAKPTLAKLSLLLKNYKNAPVAINGHTDSKGSDEYNQTLSEKRAESVKTYLSQNFDINTNRLESQGFGKSQPIAPNANPDGSDNPQGRQKNRRVEVIIRNQTATGG
ncbi:OmpA family protein [Phormidesmis sp. 146-12]